MLTAEVLTALVESHHTRLVWWLYRLTQNYQTSEDIAQATYLYVWRHRERIEFLTWPLLCTSARQRLIDRIRQRSYHDIPVDWSSAEAHEDEVDMSPDDRFAYQHIPRVAFEDAWVEAEEQRHLVPRDQISLYLSRMTRRSRVCVQMRLRGLRLREIALWLGVPIGTVKSRLYGAKKALLRAEPPVERKRAYRTA